MKSNEIRKKFLSFFESKGHTIIHSSSLVPSNDPTLMFTNSGMVQFKDIFLGSYTPMYSRATTVQRSVRTGGKHNDLENVGYTNRHHTFFEMLGNFSFGDYFKREAISFAWELLTKVYQLPKDRLLVTVYYEDNETRDIWADEIGMPDKRIIRIDDNKGSRYASDNFWMMGETGPCGPCTEIFYDHGPDIPGGPPGSLEENGDRYIEIWNLVFIEFNCDIYGNMTRLSRYGVDTGMGLERLAAVLQGVHSNYEIDLFQNLIRAAARETGITANSNNNSLNIIADHIRACSFLIVDGVIPSNEGRGYVLRRIIRRAIRHGYKLGNNSAFFHRLVADLIIEMGNAYPELNRAESLITDILRCEEERFFETIEHGMAILGDALTKINTTSNKMSGNVLDSGLAFKLHDTYGFPLDMTIDVCREHGVTVDKIAFEHEMTRQRKQMREANKSIATMHSSVKHINTKTIFHGYEDVVVENAGVIALYVNGLAVNEVKTTENAFIVVVLDHTPFYAESGGQVGDKGILINETMCFLVDNTFKIVHPDVIGHYGLLKRGVIKVGDVLRAEINIERRVRIQRNHSAIHLMHKALRNLLGEHVSQKGSLVDHDRARFDFIHNKPLTDQEIRKVESTVNAEILANVPSVIRIMSYEEAVKTGAVALFDEKYGKKVRVLNIGFSSELCGGTHVQRTGDIGFFKIVTESNVAAGIRRIEAVTGDNTIHYVQELNELINKVSSTLKTKPSELVKRINQIQDQVKSLEKELSTMKSKLTLIQGEELARKSVKVGNVHVLTAVLNNANLKSLRETVDKLKDKLKIAAIVLATVEDCKISLIAGVTLNISENIKAGDLANFVAQQIGGNGGGRPDMAQGGGTDLKNLQFALNNVKKWISDRI
ncbi:MAG: alanine--tRNA ligase [Burkholderia sp.]|nr:alanine--tRNA ligase [Burkholderia sp.]